MLLGLHIKMLFIHAKAMCETHKNIQQHYIPNSEIKYVVYTLYKMIAIFIYNVVMSIIYYSLHIDVLMKRSKNLLKDYS